ncbi:MAG TPA: alpha/beta fold hydrolase [Polyangiaceae bacterium]|nr:alpha/beta fold hydrolase [Polyangiaceae bacterium]
MAEILLVHGAWHGQWCWQDFAGRLSERGHRARAARLRGHDAAPGRIWYRIRDYVEDLRREVSQSERTPVLVGHSMGGLVVQKYLEHQPAPGAVLMASLPPGGTFPLCWRLLRKYPLTFLKANLSLSLRPFISKAEVVRELFFCRDRPLEVAQRLMTRLQNESYAAFLDTIFFALPRPRQVRAPMLVLGAEHDGFLTVRDVERTAEAYGTRAEIFTSMGHDMMLDTGWESVADRVAAWASQIDER